MKMPPMDSNIIFDYKVVDVVYHKKSDLGIVQEVQPEVTYF